MNEREPVAMNEQELHVLKCQICGRPQVKTGQQYAMILLKNHLKTCETCDKIAKKKGLDVPFIASDHSLKLDYINQLRDV